MLSLSSCSIFPFIHSQSVPSCCRSLNAPQAPPGPAARPSLAQLMDAALSARCFHRSLFHPWAAFLSCPQASPACHCHPAWPDCPCHHRLHSRCTHKRYHLSMGSHKRHSSLSTGNSRHNSSASLSLNSTGMKMQRRCPGACLLLTTLLMILTRTWKISFLSQIRFQHLLLPK